MTAPEAMLTLPGHRLEYRRLGPDGADPCLVFLHEGLGSVAMWRDFPTEAVRKSGRCGVVYSRQGHGWSDPLAGGRPLSFMDDEANEVLPAVLEALSIRRPVLIGHSDGASIALIHAASGGEVAGLVLLAPHVFVEEETIASIESLRDRFETTDLAARLARYHADPVGMFRGWNDVWLHPRFRGWDIRPRLAAITCPVMVIQGREDEYGTEAQVDAIADVIPRPVERVLLDDCGHSPHIDRPQATLEAILRFVAAHS